MQRQTMGDRGELVSTADACLTKSSRENAAHSGHKGASSSQEDTIDLAWIYARVLEKLIDAPLDGLQLVLDPCLKFGASDGNTQIHAAVAEVELRLGAPGEFKLYPLNRLVQLITEVLLDKSDEGFNLCRLQCPHTRAFENFSHVVGAQKGKVVPTFQIGIDPRRHSGKQLVQ